MRNLKLKSIKRLSDVNSDIRSYYKDANNHYYVIEGTTVKDSKLYTCCKQGEPEEEVRPGFHLWIDDNPAPYWQTALNGGLDIAEVTLADAADSSYELTEDDIDSIVTLLATRCRQATKDKLRGRVKYVHLGDRDPLYERVYRRMDSQKWCLNTGQSYPDQIRDTRELLLS
jgi:hypothetical protein